MEIESINPIIRKITIGDLKQGLTYKVGQKMLGGAVEITAIIQDEASWYKPQQVVYDVYIKSNGDKFSRPWKRFFDQPTAIEFDVEDRDSYEVQ